MNLNKLCPDCDTEYMPHVEKCADCGATLILPEERGKTQAGKIRIADSGGETRVAVREGDLDWMKELHIVLKDAGIPASVHADTGCKKGCHGSGCRLLVALADLEKAREAIEEYFMEMNPELRTSNELLRSGKCPACGSPVAEEAAECPDCGLPLIIVEEE